MSKDKICSRLELLQFASEVTKDVSIFDLCRLVESKTNHTIVEKEFIRDMLQALNSCIASITEINKDLNKKWEDVIEIMK